MANFFSSISGQFSKSVILGTLLPTTVFTILSLIFLPPLIPSSWGIHSLIEEFNFENVLAISFVIIVMSGILYNLNIPIIRFYEGYPWRHGWIGQRRTKHYVDQVRAARARWQGMRALGRALYKNNRREPEIGAVRARIGLWLNRDFPKTESEILPTRLGNVIRSFEDYPRHQYGIDSVVLWPHLLTQISKEEAGTIDDAKTAFDFMINTSLLLATLAILLIVGGMIDPFPLNSRWSVPWQWLLEFLAFAILSYLFYGGAIGCAKVWGANVKAAFDLHRLALLEQLGYQPGLLTRSVERDLWRNISTQMLYVDPPAGPGASYALRTFAQAEPDGIKLEIARGVEPPDADGRLKVVLLLKNVDERNAENVTVTDTLPDSFDYEWGSALASGVDVRVSGTDPYDFNVGDLRSGDEVLLTYRAIPRLATNLNDLPLAYLGSRAASPEPRQGPVMRVGSCLRTVVDCLRRSVHNWSDARGGATKLN